MGLLTPKNSNSRVGNILKLWGEKAKAGIGIFLSCGV